MSFLYHCRVAYARLYNVSLSNGCKFKHQSSDAAACSRSYKSSCAHTIRHSWTECVQTKVDVRALWSFEYNLCPSSTLVDMYMYVTLNIKTYTQDGAVRKLNVHV